MYPEKQMIEMYARVHGGITARLGAVARNGTLRTSRVLLDGPYGGAEGNLKVYDRVLLLGGGSGAFLLRSPETMSTVLMCRWNRCDVRGPASPRPRTVL